MDEPISEYPHFMGVYVVGGGAYAVEETAGNARFVLDELATESIGQ